MNKNLEATQFVVDHADAVHIDMDRIGAFAAAFHKEPIAHWMTLEPFALTGYREDQQLFAQLLLSTWAFSYWGEPKWTIEYAGAKLDGFYGNVACVRRAMEEGIPILDPMYCSSISEDTLRGVFRGNTEIPLFDERLAMIREIGAVISERYHGKVGSLLLMASNDAAQLLDIIIRDFPSFCDTSMYKGREVFFQKRAVFFVMNMHQWLMMRGEQGLTNFDQIPACSDYKIPQMLRQHGILVYSRGLAETIDHKIEILHGAPEEVEIRAGTIVAVDRIACAVRVAPQDVSDVLWISSQKKTGTEKPYHRSRTTAY
ncbi:hypothetical protein HY624_02410 [Candidatus Uhrbacteria bacterium]|nr:hypothetical protein [Candidatus Uhrbacteria bacterium]